MRRIDPEVETVILRHHFVDEWPVGTIARQLGVHHSVVRRVLNGRGVPIAAEICRPRLVDKYIGFIEDTLVKYPELHASRLHQMVCQRGYTGGGSHFRRIVSELRPQKVYEPFLRLHKLPCEEAQVDWGYFGTTQVGRAVRPLHAFVVTLSWSRMIWLQFFHDMQMANFLRGHVDALRFFGGVPRKLLYDNLKSEVIERQGNAIRFNERALDIANHYGFEPRAAAVRRGNEKGRVERSIRYVRTNFFAAREFRDIDDLNEQAKRWSLEISAARRWPQDDQRVVRDVFAEEREKLRALPNDEFPAYERKAVKVGRTPWVRFDRNDYSVPAKFVRRWLDVLADHKQIRVVADGDVVATHARSFDRHACVEDPAHTAALVAYKRKARQGSGNNRLVTAAPSTERFIERAAQRGLNLGNITARLLVLLEVHGALELEAAMGPVNEQDIVDVKAVRLVLEQRARAAGRKIPSPVRLLRPELAEITVRASKLDDYDNLGANDDDESEPPRDA